MYENEPKWEESLGRISTPKGASKVQGASAPPRHCWSGVGCGWHPSRQGGHPRPELDAQGGDASSFWAWGQGGRATEAELHAAPERRVSIWNLL